jgi:hypothetical protein
MADGETAATAYTIGWEPQPGPQTALLACPVFEVFFGGARGGARRMRCSANGPPMLIFTERTRSG